MVSNEQLGEVLNESGSFAEESVNQKEIGVSKEKSYSVDVMDIDNDFLADTKKPEDLFSLDDISIDIEDYIIPNRPKNDAADLNGAKEAKVDVNEELRKLEAEIIPDTPVVSASVTEAEEEDGFEKYLDREKIERSAIEPGMEATDVRIVEAVEPTPVEPVKPSEVEPVKPSEAEPIKPRELSDVEFEIKKSEPASSIEITDITEEVNKIPASKTVKAKAKPERSKKAFKPKAESPRRTSTVYDAALEALDDKPVKIRPYASEKIEEPEKKGFNIDIKKIVSSKAFRYCVIIGVPLIILLIILRYVKKHI